MLGDSSKPKPVDLVYTCTKDVDPNEEKDVPIILIHALTMSKEYWMDMDKVLASKTGKRVYSLDLRNHGESPYTDEYDVETMTEDVIHLLDKLNISKAILFGHSMGGKVTVHLALNYPTRFEKIIVEDIRPNTFSPESLEEVYSYFRIWKEVGSVVDKGLTEKETKEMLIKLQNEEYKKMNLDIEVDDTDYVPIKFVDGKCQWKINPMLIPLVLTNFKSMWNESNGRFEGSSLFIYGTESNFKVNEDESNIKSLFPNAQLVGVKGAGHMVHTFPEFMDVVVPFINGKEA